MGQKIRFYGRPNIWRRCSSGFAMCSAHGGVLYIQYVPDLTLRENKAAVGRWPAAASYGIRGIGSVTVVRIVSVCLVQVQEL